MMKEHRMLTASFPDSTSISQAAYDAVLETLEVTFRTGRKYRYQNVPKATFTRLSMAPSAGKYFATKIRPEFVYAEVAAPKATPAKSVAKKSAKSR
jgi:hypothetical protein